jgi:RAT1-interacting protein
MDSRKRPVSEVEDATEVGPNKMAKRHLDRLSNRPDSSPRDPATSNASSTAHRLPYPSKSAPAPPVLFQQPSTLLTFSYTPQRVLEFTDSALRYYVGAPPRAELRYGYERWVKRPEEKGRLDGLLRAVARYGERLDGVGVDGKAWLRDVAVVSWRGVMTK